VLFRPAKDPGKIHPSNQAHPYHLIAIARKPEFVIVTYVVSVFKRSKGPLDLSHRAVVSPFNQDPLIYFYLFNILPRWKYRTSPRPDDVLPASTVGTFGEPKNRLVIQDRQRFEHFRHWLADEHLCFGNTVLVLVEGLIVAESFLGDLDDQCLTPAELLQRKLPPLASNELQISFADNVLMMLNVPNDKITYRPNRHRMGYYATL